MTYQHHRAQLQSCSRSICAPKLGLVTDALNESDWRAHLIADTNSGRKKEATACVGPLFKTRLHWRQNMGCESGGKNTTASKLNILKHVPHLSISKRMNPRLIVTKSVTETKNSLQYLQLLLADILGWWCNSRVASYPQNSCRSLSPQASHCLLHLCCSLTTPPFESEDVHSFEERGAQFNFSQHYKYEFASDQWCTLQQTALD